VSCHGFAGFDVTQLKLNNQLTQNPYSLVMFTADTYIMIAMISYMVIVIAIGFVYARRNEKAGDFYLGGRKLGPVVTAMSAEASDIDRKSVV
jgi:hypothetical protein